MRRNWLISLVWLIGAGSLLLMACGQEQTPVGEAAVEIHGEEDGHEEEGQEAPGFVSIEEAKRLGPMEVQAAELRTLSGVVSATGEVRSNPDRVAHLTARLSGWIQEVHAFQEDTVKKGEVLARIDSPEFLTAQTEYLMALRRSQAAPGPKEGRTAQALLASARSRLLLLGAWEEDIEALALSGQSLRYLKVRSPIRGTVIESNLIRGTAIGPGDNLYRLADLSTLWVILDIVEQDLARVRKGAEVGITTGAFPDESFQGTLTLLSQMTQEATRTVQARVIMENTQGKLRPGMFVRGEVAVLGGPEVLTVPESAVFLYQGQETVFVQKEDGYQATPIQAGRSRGGRVEILGGLKAGIPVVVHGGFDLKAQIMKEMMGAGHGH